MKNTIFESAIASIEEIPSNNFKHPFLTVAEFVFADDKGNVNGQGIELEDFPAVALSAIDMPVKMKFTGRGTESHTGSVPIGHIKTMDIVAEDGINKLIATAVLYADEFPEEITFLKDAFASGLAPGISWELAYKDSIVKEGIEWLKSIVTKAATFVRTPAYGSRTHLMALASSDEGSLIELAREILAQANVSNDDKGGNNVTEEELKKLQEKMQAEAASKDSEITRLTTLLGEKDGEIQKLSDEVGTMKQAALIETRTQQIVAAGIPLEADAEKLTKKKGFWASLTEDAFNEYLSDLVAAKQSAAVATASAAGNGEGLPRMSVTTDTIDFGTLKNGLKSLSRNSQ
jgi:hypothetical protein